MFGHVHFLETLIGLEVPDLVSGLFPGTFVLIEDKYFLNKLGNKFWIVIWGLGLNI